MTQDLYDMYRLSISTATDAAQFLSAVILPFFVCHIKCHDFDPTAIWRRWSHTAGSMLCLVIFLIFVILQGLPPSEGHLLGR